MNEAVKVSPKEFEKQPDGSWLCVKNSDIKSNYGVYRIAPGTTFEKGKPLWGIDVAELLEQANPN
ncbi:hypothetical protein [Desulfosarcina ovata]|uniref:Uncharacterized protein n=3 Tax=Desulfosarcina ovata TaxID=83564 RepID=A0A5K8AER0_9BACT|nr:hypothetical protein [Desulfosarcina ovata]BBO83976.1 hypothetical protein DSCO28_45420 [Desulfosarcina ovata subsp. sediminis]BBO90454.1 hypothetical protein DSCOOX_36340 [Desulfosarcina ovata subsp. ovata]